MRFVSFINIQARLDVQLSSQYFTHTSINIFGPIEYRDSPLFMLQIAEVS